MSDKNKKPLVDEELLNNSGAEPEAHNVPDEPLLDPEADSNRDRIPSERDGVTDPTVDDFAALLQQKEDRYLRLYAEFENYKRRNQRERLSLIETAGASTMKALLPVLDDFDRASKGAAQDEASKKVYDSGVGLIVKKLYQALAGQGLKPMESTGEAFNPDLHEALTEIPSPEMAGKVVDTVESGYTLNGKIIRHAKVVVGK